MYRNDNRQGGGARTIALIALVILAVAAYMLNGRFGFGVHINALLVKEDPSLPPTVASVTGPIDRKKLNLACNGGDTYACATIFGERFDGGRKAEAMVLLAGMVKRLKEMPADKLRQQPDLDLIRQLGEQLLANNGDATALSPGERAVLGLDMQARANEVAASAERRKTSRSGLDSLVKSAPGLVPTELHVEQGPNELTVKNVSRHDLTVRISSFFEERNQAGEVVANHGCFWISPPDKFKPGSEMVRYAPDEVHALVPNGCERTANGRAMNSVPLNFSVYDNETKLYTFLTK